MLTGIMEVDQGTFSRLLEFNIKAGGNIAVFGQAGIGKTEIPQQIAERLGFPVYYVNLSVLEAPDLLGLPIIKISDGVERVKYARPDFLPVEGTVFIEDETNGVKTKRPTKVVLLVDELDKSKPELQNPLLELFQSHTLNGQKLDIQAIVATGNLPDEGAHSQPVSHALMNRCKVYKLTHSYEPWRDWAQTSNLNALIVGFLSRNQDYLSKKPVEGDPTAYCRPSPRSWSQAARELDKCEVKESVDFQSLIVAGRVGMEAAAKFRVWLDHYRHIEPLVDKLVDEGIEPDMKGMDIDKQLVCAIGAVNAVNVECRKKVTDKVKQKEKIHKMAKSVFKWIQKIPSEFQIGAVKSTLHMDLITQWELTKIPEVMTTYLNIRKAMKD